MAEFFDVLPFRVDKRQDLTMTEIYQEVANVTLLGAELGTYEYGFSMTAIYDQANKSEFIQFSIDGGVVWTEFSSEPADKTDDKPMMYTFFKEGVSGDLTYQMEVRKEDATGVMTVGFVDAWIRRVA